MADKSEPKKDSRSLPRKAFDKVERAVANKAEPLAQSGPFAGVLGVYVSVNRGVRGVLGKATGGLLHLVTIPTTGDIRKLHQHLSSVDNHIAELIRQKEREAQETEVTRSMTAKPAATTKTGSRRTGPSNRFEQAAPSSDARLQKPKAGGTPKASPGHETTGSQ